MIEKKPKTYNEIIRMKKCYTLSNYYSNITENIFNEIYDFLGESSDNSIVANTNLLSFVDSTTKVVKTYPLVPKNLSIDAVKINNDGISVIPHYTPSSRSSYSSSSSNNNNNNNNNGGIL